MGDSESISVQSVISNDDLLTEILVRLPALSLRLFKSVSKRWRSLIKHAINVTVCRNLDPPSGLFLQKTYRSSFRYDFVPFDMRISICRSSCLIATNFTFGPEVQHKSDYVDILDSCNGLLLCRTYSWKLYVYNPSITNMFKVLPNPVVNCLSYSNSCLKMTFDPTKSPHYKVIYVDRVGLNLSSDNIWYQIHIYSSKTSNWSVCGHRFPRSSFFYFSSGVYWNDAIYWLNGEDEISKLDIMNEHPVLIALRIPFTLYRNVRGQCWLFESRGCLLLVAKGDAGSPLFTIYEKGNMYSEWSLKYTVNLDDIIKLPEHQSVYKKVFYIVLGEKEEDSFLVMKLDQKVIQYKFLSKTLNTISDLEQNCDFRCLQFVPSFANV